MQIDFQPESSAAPKPPGPHELGAPEQAAIRMLGNFGDLADVGKNLVEGAGSGVLSTIYHGGDLIRRALGMERIIDKPEVQKLIAPQPGPGGGLGRTIEQMAEFAVPAGRMAKAVEKAPLLARAGAEALASGATAAVQTGGDPGTTGLAAVLGAAGPVVSKGAQAAKRLLGAPAETGTALTRSEPGAVAAPRPSSPDAQALELAGREGIPVPTSVATGNRFAKSAEQMGGRTILGSGIAKRAQERTAEAMQRTSEGLAARAHATPTIPETAGAGLKTRLEARIHGLKTEADEAYGEFRQAAENPRHAVTIQTGTEALKSRDAAGKQVVKPILEKIQLPVDIRKIKAQLVPVLEEMSWMPAADRASSAGYTAVKKIIEGPDVISAVSAEHGLSGLKDMARQAVSADLRTESQGLAAGIIPDLQANIDAAAAKAGVSTQLRAGRAAHALKMEAADVLGKLRSEPVQVFDQATYAKDSGIDLLRKLKQWAPAEMQKVGRGYLEKLFDKAKQEGGFGHGENLWSQWEKLGPETKKILYPNPILRKDLDSFFLLGKRLSEVPNPSGTAATQHALGQLGMTVVSPVSGISYILATGAMTKLLYSPSGARLLQRAMQASNKIAAGAPSRIYAAPITALLARVGDEAQPVKGKKTGIDFQP